MIYNNTSESSIKLNSEVSLFVLILSGNVPEIRNRKLLFRQVVDHQFIQIPVAADRGGRTRSHADTIIQEFLKL